ncbi:MAG: hypothetical protein KGO00_09020, partial [Bacteroidetes bacterium]|nr:hypothetical protein [Bacteroidota bacterium]
FLYVGIYVVVVSACYRAYINVGSKLALALFLMKLSFIFPLMTSNFDSYSYILYLTWLLTGIFISSISTHETSGSRHTGLAQ